jgi:hypothetical protein
MWIVAVILLLLLLTALLFPLRLYFDFNGNLSRIFLGLKFFRLKKEIEKELNLFKKKIKILLEKSLLILFKNRLNQNLFLV